MTPSSGKFFSLLFLPATPLYPSRTLAGLFEMTQHSSRALDSPDELLPELQRSKDAIKSFTPGSQDVCHEQMTQTLIVSLLKTHLFS